MPMPTTSWLARRVTLRHGLQQRHRDHAQDADRRGRGADRRWPTSPARRQKAAVSIMPSRLMFSTPARSDDHLAARRPASAAWRAGSSEAEEDGEQFFQSAPLPAVLDQDQREPATAITIRPWMTSDQRGRHAGHDLHGDAAGAQEAEQQRAGDHARRSSRATAGRRRGRRSRSPRRSRAFSVYCSPCSMMAPARPPNAPASGSATRSAGSASACRPARRQRVEPDRAQPQAEGRALQDDADDDGEQQADRQADVQRRFGVAGQQRAAGSRPGSRAIPAASPKRSCGWRSSAVDCTRPIEQPAGR